MHHYRTNMEEIDRDKFDHHHPQDHHQPPPLPAANGNHQSPPSQPPRKCPRCDSSNTKFCYYNNYSLSQPRYFCKACRRYWTQGGTLRNIPVGGVCRKGGKRHRRSASASSRDDTGGTRSSPSEFRSSRNPTTMIAPDSAIRVPPSIGNSFYSGGGFLSSLAAGQSAPSNQAAAVAFGGVNGENMALLQRINFSSMAARQFQARNEFFTSQQSLNSNPPGGLNSYLSQGFLNGDPATSFSAAGQGSWSAAAAAENQAGSNSFSPAQWPDHKYQGFPPQ